MLTQDKIVDTLHQHGIKATPQRLAIIDFLIHNRIHPTADDIFQHLHPSFPSLSVATVYNTLEMLESISAVMKLKICNKNKVNYDFDTSVHPHFFCTRCHRIFDVELPWDMTTVTTREGHQIDDLQLYMKGTCVHCVEAGPNNSN